MKLLTICTLLTTFLSYGQASKYHKKFAFINLKGEVALDVSAKYAYSFSNERARVGVYTVVGNKAYYNYGFIDEKGEMVIPAIYDKAYDFDEDVDVTWVRKRGEDKYILIDKNGKRVGNVAYKNVGFWIDGMCSVTVDNKDLVLYSGEYGKQYGFINPKGEVVLDPDGGYFDVSSFSEGLACITQKGAAGYGFIDKTGKIIIPLTLKQSGVSGFQNGLARAKKNGKTGLIDKTGKFVVQPVYSTVSGFGDGLLTVSFGSAYDNFGYVDYNNKVVIKGQFDRATSFENGFAEVSINGKEGIINKKGEYILPAKYGTVYNEAKDGYFMTNTDNNWQFFDTTGTEITEAKAKSKNGIPIPIYNRETKEWYYYNSDNKKAFQYKFCRAKRFTENGLALVELCDDEQYSKGKITTSNASNSSSTSNSTASFKVGDRVLGYWKKGSKSYPGIIDKVEGNRYYIKYDDGDVEWTTAQYIKLSASSSKTATTASEDLFSYTYKSSKFNWEFKLNGKPIEELSKTKSGKDMSKITSPKSSTYQISANATDLGKPAKKSKIDDVLEKTATTVLDKLGGTVKTKEFVDVNGTRAYRAIMVKGNIHYYYLNAVRGRYFYQCIYYSYERDFDNWKTLESTIKIWD